MSPRAPLTAAGLPVRLAGLILLVAGLLLAAAAPASRPAGPPAQRPVLVAHLDGAIGPASSQFLDRSLEAAAARDAALLVLRLDTPGGLDTSMREMIQAIIAAETPVAVYVAPSGARAASAGTYLIYASHLAAMAPGTNLGAATPVALGGPPAPGADDEAEESAARPAAEAKALNDAIAYIRSLAELRGRDADWAEAAVREAASLDARAALSRGVIEIVAADVDDLLAQADGRTVRLQGGEVTLALAGPRVEHLRPDWRFSLLGAITNPNVALILMMLGVYGLMFEFMNPGALYPGVIGAVCLLLGFYALAVLPVNYAGAALILLGLALMVGEAFAPSFGALGLGGAAAFVLGAMILFDLQAPGFRLSASLVAGLAIASAAFALLAARLALGAHRRRPTTGREEMIGARGVVLDWSGAAGHVFVRSERWRAVAGAPLAPGQTVRVTALDGLTLTVAAEPAAAEPAPTTP